VPSAQCRLDDGSVRFRGAVERSEAVGEGCRVKAQSPIGDENRRQLGNALRTARRKAGPTPDALAARFCQSTNKLSLIEAARVGVFVEHVTLLDETCRVPWSERPALLELAPLPRG
jgi:hypothetical protein